MQPQRSLYSPADGSDISSSLQHFLVVLVKPYVDTKQVPQPETCHLTTAEVCGRRIILTKGQADSALKHEEGEYRAMRGILVTADGNGRRPLYSLEPASI